MNQLPACDVCHATDRPVQRYLVGQRGRRTSFDLCAEHAAPLEALLALKQGVTPFAQRVTTLEDIERLKREKP